MSVPKKTINEVVDETVNYLDTCKNLFDNLKHSDTTFPESILMHLVMLRTEIAGMVDEIDNMQHILENYSFENYKKQWIEVLDRVHEEHGSWENRKKYSPWGLHKIN